MVQVKLSFIIVQDIKRSSSIKRFVDGNERHSFPNGEEFTNYTDGSIKAVNQSGDKVVEYTNGLRDVVMKDGRVIKIVGEDLMSIKDI